MADITYKLNFTGDQINNLLTRVNNLDTDAVIRKAAPKNLLDNSDFRGPVNQRGQTSYALGSWGGYCIDRWAVGANGANVTVGSDGLTLSNAIYQPIASDVIARYNGKVLTLAVKMAGSVYCCSGEVKQIGTWNVSAHSDTPYGYIRFETETDNKMFVIIDSSTTSSVIEWAALYEGEYTSETLPEYQPKGYAAELAECQRYFYRANVGAYSRIGFGATTPSTEIVINVTLPVKMRAMPAITTPSNGWVIEPGGTAVKSIGSFGNQSGNEAQLHVKTETEVSGALRLLNMSESPTYIDFIADI